MPLAYFYYLLVLVIERQVLRLLLELAYPVVDHLLVLMIQNFQGVRLWNIVANGHSVEVVFWLIDIDLESHQRDDLGRNPLVARGVDD